MRISSITSVSRILLSTGTAAIALMAAQPAFAQTADAAAAAEEDDGEAIVVIGSRITCGEDTGEERNHKDGST